MTSNYQMWLTHDGEKEKIQLPVLPESLDLNNGSSLTSVKVISLGEVVMVQGRPALQISFSSFFPASKFPGLQVSEPTPPLLLIEKINKWKESRLPVHLICTACGIDLYCLIDKFSYSEKGGDVGTYHYSITLKEYREVALRQVLLSTAAQVNSAGQITSSTVATVQSGAEAPRANNTTPPKTHKVVRGDCLWNLAKKYYGNGAKYTKIHEANRSLIGPNPNVLMVGWVLTIP